MKSTPSIIVTALWLSLATAPAIAQTNHNPGIGPINARAHGKTYSQLAAAWWIWALQTPTPEHAGVDPTRATCASNQTHHVWFLAGTFDGAPVTRTCTI